MAANRTLYVNCNPATLIRDEQALIRAGYDVDSVFGADGLLACESVAEYASVLIDGACPLWRREKMISWLRSTYPKIDILPTAGSASSQPKVCRRNAPNVKRVSFPPRPPRKAALPCSAGSRVLRHSPTSPARSRPPFGLWPSRTGLRPLTKECRRFPGSRGSPTD
jgi:hypothetical protein